MKRQCVLAACVAALTIISVLAIPAMPQHVNQKTFETEQPANINASTIIQSPNITTEYNIHYRLVKYENLVVYANGAQVVYQTTDILGVIGMYNNTISTKANGYRVMALKNGSFYVFNMTNYKNYYTIYTNPECGMVKGMEFSLLTKWNVDTSDFEPQKIIQFPNIIENGIAVFGKNKTSNNVTEFALQFNETSLNFDYIYNTSIPLPSTYFNSINNVLIKDICLFNNQDYIIGGKYINSTTSIPFLYMFNSTLELIGDFCNLSTSQTDYRILDDIVYGVQDSVGTQALVVITNKNISLVPMIYNYTISDFYFGQGLTYSNNIQEIPNSAFVIFRMSKPLSFFNITSFGQEIRFTYDYYDFTTGKASNFAVSTNFYSGFWIANNPITSFLTRWLDADNLMGMVSDISDGVITYGSDQTYTIWQSWVVGSGSIGGIFDLYIPQVMIFEENGGNGDNLEVYYSDSRGLWFIQFNNNDTGVLAYGNSSAKKIVTQRMDVFHARNTKSFQFSVSGYIERASNLCEVGVVPLYMNPFNIDPGAMGTMYSVNRRHYFRNSEDGGVVTIPTSIFQGTGSNIIEFQASFESDYFPQKATFIGNLELVLVFVYYLVWERYENGTYTQKLFRDYFTAKSVITSSTFVLETSLSIQDSHMLDELHIYSNGLEYNPYDVVLTQANNSLLITDKVTNATLFSGYAEFRDPLPVPIPSKYEFFISYFSNIDRFGLEWNLVNTFINGTRVTTPNVRILSPNANIVVKDFAGSLIKNVTVNKELDGIYINIGLDIATLIVSNNYNKTIIFYLSKNDVTISYSIPSLASIVLRLALGTYRYLVTDTDGNEIFDKEITLDASSSISMGSWTLTFPEDPRVQAQTEINIIVSVIAIAGIAAAGIVVAAQFAKRVNKSKKRTPWG